ncbi:MULTISPECIES: hypothetical protein [unclassified Moraxella]|uniref:hypothetical protein n=1 Tax=unclassified Moraxella TaxID=2685852 RepID=UPI003AF8F587
MKIFVDITSEDWLVCQEALSLALALASFEHDIQLKLGEGFLSHVMAEPTGKLANMLSSLELYDLQQAWIAHELWQKIQLSKLADEKQLVWLTQVMEMPEPLPVFEQQITL